ncbi:hypothetical protein T492DRAFT_843319 [Pavlovales sp. CCMP2436]|nr:hypothetical protein T492DRAFT_843319 [Pavlovales sp. CCMP2436]
MCLRVADTFALVRPPPPLGSSHTADKVSLQPLLLTAHAIPRVLAWLADGTEGRVAERVRMPLASPKPLTGDSAVQRLRCGEHYLLCGLLLPGGGATLVPPQGAHAVCAELMGQLYCFEEGIGFDSDRLGPVAIPFHLALESLSIFDGGSTFDASAEGEVDSAAAALVEEEAHMRGHQWLGFGGGAPVPLEEEEGEEHSLKLYYLNEHILFVFIFTPLKLPPVVLEEVTEEKRKRREDDARSRKLLFLTFIPY